MTPAASIRMNMTAIEGLVSVVVPTYNVGPLARVAVLSVLGQTYENLEVIVVNDGSTDDSIQSLADIADPRLTVINQARRGVSVARNTGLKASAGYVVAFLDADDLWYPEKISRSLALLQSNVAVGSKMQYIGEDGAPLKGYAGQDPAGPALHKIRLGELMPFPISSTLFRREAVEAAGEFDENLVQAEDLDFLLRVAQLGQISWAAEPLGAYRLRARSVSAARYSEQRMYWRYVVARARFRATGSDLSLEDFKSTYEVSPREHRIDRAAAQYRRAGLLLANHQRARGAAALVRAFLISPRYTTVRLRNQSRGSVSRG